MVNLMRYLLILALLFSSNLFAQDTSPASCTGPINTTICMDGTKFCPDGSGFIKTSTCNSGKNDFGQCKGQCSCSDGKVLQQGICQCPADTQWNSFPNGGGSCLPRSCPQGYIVNVITNSSGNIASCIPDPDASTGGCAAGQVDYMGLCRDAVASPGDCGSTYSTAVGVGSGYVCTNTGCESGQTQSIFSNASGSWNVCNGDGDGSGNASSGSNTSGSNNSAGGDSSGGNTSSPSSSGGDGDGDGDSNGPPGTGGGSGGGDGSGNNTSGGATSSTQGGGGTLPTQSSSSVSSGHGAASSGSGAGNCDPTAHNYLDCISRDNPGNGDGEGDAFEPSGGKGDFDGEAAAKRRAELEQQIADEIENIKQEISQELGGNVRGSGTITDKCVSVFGQQVCFGLAKFSGDLAVISQAIFMMVCVICVGIVLRN